MKKANWFVLLFGWVLLFSYSFAQEASEIHPVHINLKYDTSFQGIGPRVYILPPPKSREQLLLENYALKWESLQQIEAVIGNIELEKRLHDMAAEVQHLPSVEDSVWLSMNTEQRLLASIHYYEQLGQASFVADLQNDLANYYFLKGLPKKADSLYTISLSFKEKMGQGDGSEKIIENIAFLKEKEGAYDNALFYYQRLLELAAERKDRDKQAAIFLSMANIEALRNNYTSAQRMGVQKSITIYKRTKNYAGIVQVLNDLAAFTMQQQKYVEAKWYYLQAIDVANTHMDMQGLAISLYNLGMLKNTIQDYTLAIDDFKRAARLADSMSMEILLLKIKNGLGDSYLQSGDYTAALLLLDEFNFLKSNFLRKSWMSNKSL